MCAPSIGPVPTPTTIEGPNTPVFTPPTASDLCGGATVNELPDTTAAGTWAKNDSRTKPWDATDACGNHSVTRTQTITVVDTTAPSIGKIGRASCRERAKMSVFAVSLENNLCGGGTGNELTDTTTAGDCAKNYSRSKTRER